METKVIEYKNAGQFQGDAAKLAEQGWSVQSQSERTQRSGCARIVMLGGIGALIWKPKPHIVVTYSRE